MGMGEGEQRLGDRLPHVGCWPAWGALPWGLWGRRGAGGTFYLLAQGGAGDDMFVWPLWPPTPPPPSLQVFPWLTVLPGSCPWFLMIVTLFLRALKRETPRSDSQPTGFLLAQPLPLKPCPPRCLDFPVSPAEPGSSGRGGPGSLVMEHSFFQGVGNPPTSSRMHESLWAHTLSLKHPWGTCTTTHTHLSRSLTHPGPQGPRAPWP